MKSNIQLTEGQIIEVLLYFVEFLIYLPRFFFGFGEMFNFVCFVIYCILG